MHDAALELLSPYLCGITVPTWWFADESALPLLQQLKAAPSNLRIFCNRYDLYQLAVNRGFIAEYNDFTPPVCRLAPVRVLYRVSKEKSLVHHVLILSAQHLSYDGELVLTGQKQDGIKGYYDKLSKNFACRGRWRKKGTAYLGHYTHFRQPLNQSSMVDNYRQLQKIYTQHATIPFFYSKPGIFGWKKIDRGSELLLSCLADFIGSQDTSTQSVLDLGCGYGWLFMNLGRYHFNQIVATDNNSAALFCAQKNSDVYRLNVDIIPSDAGDKLTEYFDLILCNPPFHQGFKHSQRLTHKFIDAIAKRLRRLGNALLVVNEFIPIEKISQEYHLHTMQLCRREGFKVLRLFH